MIKTSYLILLTFRGCLHFLKYYGIFKHKKIAYKFIFILVIINTKLSNMKLHKFINYKYIATYKKCYIANFLAYIAFENYINKRPRKYLYFKTPTEVFILKL